MKRKLYTLIAFVITFTTTSPAQITKGSILLGGTLGFTTSKEYSPTVKQTTINVSPAFGIAIHDNVILGGSLQYGIVDTDGYFNNLNLAAGVFLRKYKALGKGFYLFGESTSRFNFASSQEVVFLNQNQEIYDNKNYSVGLSLQPGISYELSKRLQLELMFTDLISVNYTWKKKVGQANAYVYNRKGRSFSLNSNLSVNGINSIGIGVRFLLTK